MTTKEYLEIKNKYPSEKYNAYEGWKDDLNRIIEFNKNLIDKYPWLKPYNRWTGETPDEYDYTYTELDSMPEGWRLAFGDEMVERIHQELVKFNYADRYRIETIKEKWGGLRWYDGGTPIGKLSEDYKEASTSGTPWYPPYDQETEFLQEVGRDHYISFYDKNVDMTQEEINQYNLNAVYHFRIYKIEERCLIPEIISKYEKLSYKTCIRCGKPAEYISKGWISPYCTDCANKRLDTEYNQYRKMWENKPDKLETLKRGSIEDNYTRIEKDK